MERIKELLNEQNDMDYVFNKLEKEHLMYIVNDYVNMKNIISMKTNKYFKTEKGKLKNREAQKRYYYKKHNKYHVKYNPTGIKKIKKSKL